MTESADHPWPLAAALGGFFAYALFRASPTISLGDSGELAAVAATLGVGHSPGYPLFSIVHRLGAVLLPFGNDAYRVSVIGIAESAAALGLVASLFRSWGASWTSCAAAVLLWGWAPLWQEQSAAPEVFALNSLLAVAILLLCVRPESQKPETVRRLLLASFLLGIGLANNQTLLLLTPVLMAAFWRTAFGRPSAAALAAGAFALGLTLYVFIPLRAARIPLMDWEEPATVERFWKLVTRARYGMFQLAQGDGASVSFDALGGALAYLAGVLWENLGPAVLLIAGIAAAWQEPAKRRAILLLVGAFAVSGPFFIMLTHVSPTTHTRFVLDRFCYLPFASWMALTGLALASIVNWIGRRTKAGRRVFLAMVACYSLFAPTRFSDAWRRHDFLVWDLGRALLRNTPPHAWLFADRADEAEFSLAYLQRVSHVREDVNFIDCNAGVSRSIYGPRYYDIWGPPRLALRTAREGEIVRAGGRPVFYATHDPRMVAIPREPEGLLFRVPSTASAGKVLWDDLLVLRPWRDDRGRLPAWERSLHADALQLLARDALEHRDVARARRLYSGAFAYFGNDPWRAEMERYLRSLTIR